MKYPVYTTVVLGLFSLCALADDINFTTFTGGVSIDATVGGTSTIAFNYAGNKFVGSVFFNNQLYSTDLSGAGLTKFGSPIPESSASVGEVVLGASLGQAGFAKGDVYVGSAANGNIYHYNNSGTSENLFTSLPTGSGTVRQIFFDPGNSFGGDMLVTTTAGEIFRIDSAGSVSLVAKVGGNTEGMDIAASAWGPYAGDLLVGSESRGTLSLVSPGGAVTEVGSPGQFPGAETVSFVPSNLNPSDPLQGFYVANYDLNVQFAAASNFTGLQGDAIITDEFGGNTMWDVHYNGSTFDITPFTFTGNSIHQFEDGIFVTSAREVMMSTPEPSTLLLTGAVLLGLGLRRRIVR